MESSAQTFFLINWPGRIAAMGQARTWLLLTAEEEVRDGVLVPGSLCEIPSLVLGILRYNNDSFLRVILSAYYLQ